MWAVTLVAPLLRAGPARVALRGGGACRGVLLAPPSRPAAAVAPRASWPASRSPSATAAVRGAAREASPLRTVAADGRTASVVLELDGDPHVLGGAGRRRGWSPTRPSTALRRRGHDAPARWPRCCCSRRRTEWRGAAPGPAGPGAGRRLAARAGRRRGGGALRARAAGARRRPGRAAADAPAACGTALRRRPRGGCSTRGRPGCCRGWSSATPARMDPVLEEDFRRAGLAHLTAVSGANVAIVLAGVLWPLRRRAVDRRVQAVVAGARAGRLRGAGPAEPSVVRAAAMGAVTLLALASGRPRAAVPALAAAVCVLLLLDPGLARDPGFALSVAATAAIVLLAPGWSRRLRERGWPAGAGRRGRGERGRRAGHGAAGRRRSRGRSAWSRCRPTCSPRRRSPRPRCSGCWPRWSRCPSRRRPTRWCGCAGWPTRWLVAGRRARRRACPTAAAGWPAGTAGAVLLTVAPAGRRLGAVALPPAAAARAGRAPRAASLLGLAGAAGRPGLAARRTPSSSPATSGRATPWSLPDGARGRRCSWTPARTSGAVDRCLDRLGDRRAAAGPDVPPGRRPRRRPGRRARRPGRRGRGHRHPLAGRRPGRPAFDALVRRAGGERAVLVPGRPAHRRCGDGGGARARPGAGHRGGGGQRPVAGRPGHRARRAGPVHRRPRAPRPRRGSSPAASICGPTCSRCRTTAARTPTRSSSPPAAPAWR